MTEIRERTVLFADLRGSTSLYETLGNSQATAVVTQRVAALASVVEDCKGQVVKTLGDGLMAVFANPALAVRAADEMHGSIDRVPSAHVPLFAAHGVPALKLQVALAHGEVVEISGDCFGDAVNVAARLLDHAGDNETLATETVLSALDRSENARFRSLDRMQLRGRVEPVHVYLLEGRRTGDIDTTAYGGFNPVGDPEGIRLVWQNLNRVFSGPSLPVVLGRSSQATYCVDDSRVSRSHARVDWHGGTFQLSDLSYNGTYVRFTNGTDVLSLRRSACTLHGSGTISLGTPSVEAAAPCVRFEVLRFSDTQPHDLEPIRE